MSDVLEGSTTDDTDGLERSNTKDRPKSKGKGTQNEHNLPKVGVRYTDLRDVDITDSETEGFLNDAKVLEVGLAKEGEDIHTGRRVDWSSDDDPTADYKRFKERKTIEH